VFEEKQASSTRVLICFETNVTRNLCTAQHGPVNVFCSSSTVDWTCPVYIAVFKYQVTLNSYVIWGSSSSIVSGYRLDDRAIEVRSPAEAKDFSSSLCVQTGSGAHQASCTMGTGGHFPGDKALP
jgi:hypothetical protein